MPSLSLVEAGMGIMSIVRGSEVGYTQGISGGSAASYYCELPKLYKVIRNIPSQACNVTGTSL